MNRESRTSWWYAVGTEHNTLLWSENPSDDDVALERITKSRTFYTPRKCKTYDPGVPYASINIKKLTEKKKTCRNVESIFHKSLIQPLWYKQNFKVRFLWILVNDLFKITKRINIDGNLILFVVCFCYKTMFYRQCILVPFTFYKSTSETTKRRKRFKYLKNILNAVSFHIYDIKISTSIRICERIKCDLEWNDDRLIVLL